MSKRKTSRTDFLKKDSVALRCTQEDRDRWERAVDAAKKASFSAWAREVLDAECKRLGVS